MSDDITVVKSHAIGPAIPEPEQLERRVQEASEIFSELWEASRYVGAWRSPVDARASAWLTSDAPALIAALDKFDQPTTKNDIATQVMMLLAAFPNASRPELKIYSKTLAADIGAMQPGRLAVEWACRKLRRTCKFVPTIAEVLDAVHEAATRIKNTRWLVTMRIPEIIREMDREREREFLIAAERSRQEQERRA
jgi:hypothetical protein